MSVSTENKKHPSHASPQAAGKKGPGLWSFNFFFLWQGQLISALGDVAYEIALGFWVLAVTGSTGLMGALMAASTVPRVLLSPFAGVFVDRRDRKWLMVAADAIRGVVVLGVAVGIFLGYERIWMVFLAGIVIGLCSSIFNPAVSSVIPDIVDKEKLQKANSWFSMIHSGSGVLGNAAGGLMFSVLGAPLMFLINGLSYLFSGAAETVLKIPQRHQRTGNSNYRSDLKSGFLFVWRNHGLRSLMLTAACLNFFLVMSFTLVLPLFQRSEALGPVRYGVTMAVFSGAMLISMVFTASVPIPPKRRLTAFSLSMIAFVVSLITFSLLPGFTLMPVTVAIAGFCVSIVNVMISTVLQLAIPAEHRGKVFGLLEMLSSGLAPVGMALGGVLGEFLPLRWVISGSLVLMGLFILPQLGSEKFKVFFALGESEKEDVDEEYGPAK